MTARMSARCRRNHLGRDRVRLHQPNAAYLLPSPLCGNPTTLTGKSRLVPLHPTTSAALRSYANRRDAHLGPRGGSTFFVAEQGGRLLHQYVHRVFWRLSREIGLRHPGDRTGPRVHDLRHRFAIRTLLDWHREGKNVEQQLPALSTYLGHACVRDTYWYLSACPELMEEAARRLDRRWEATP